MYTKIQPAVNSGEYVLVNIPSFIKLNLLIYVYEVTITNLSNLQITQPPCHATVFYPIYFYRIKLEDVRNKLGFSKTKFLVIFLLIQWKLLNPTLVRIKRFVGLEKLKCMVKRVFVCTEIISV